MKTVVTKAEFAKLKNRQPSAISNWIADGRITKAALVGEGVRARIWVEQAERDLARSLDPGQQAHQAAPIELPILGAEAPAEDAETADRSTSTPKPLVVSDDLARRRRADADRAEFDAEQARRRLAIDEGRWVDAAEAQKRFTRELTKQIAETETFLSSSLARSLADRFGLDWKEVAVELRAAYRSHRQTVAEQAAEQLEAHRQASAAEEIPAAA